MPGTVFGEPSPPSQRFMLNGPDLGGGGTFEFKRHREFFQYLVIFLILIDSGSLIISYQAGKRDV